MAEESISEARSRREREEKATQLAISQAIKDDRVARQLQEHSERLNKHDQQFAKLWDAVNDVKKVLSKIETLAEAQAKAANASLSNRNFAFGVIALIITVVVTLAAGGKL